MHLSQQAIQTIRTQGRSLGLDEDQISQAIESADEEVAEGRFEAHAVRSAFSSRSPASSSAKAEFNRIMFSPDTSFWLKCALGSAVGSNNKRVLDDARKLLSILERLHQEEEVCKA
ncbi:hypothetical protein FY034_17575 (plasmid) [Trichlorobacter lovleyi]|uniref:hypothetical protein n=1 Tax=Trichlorobacter lovleyi TaxID=313985 RepID=UPI00224052A9|nr:hypothetical protein [Trichlorobacter lovleyi]QOX80834.1 hypothetical protein FY034_17575 [Trichlorobacter lovleyi]